MKTILTTAIVLFLFVGAKSQISYEKRIEINLRNGYSKEVIYESKNGFFILESVKDGKVNGQEEIKYDLYNENFENIKTETVLIPRGMSFDELYYNDDYIYKSYKNKKDFLIFAINFKNLEISKYEGSIPSKANFTDMKVLGNKAYFLTKIKKAPILYKVDITSGKGGVIPLNIGVYSPKKTEIKNFQLLEETEEIIILSNVNISKLSSEAYFSVIDKNGKIQKAIKISSVNENNIISISSYRQDDNTMIITGTYSKNGSLSEGLFFGKIENNQIEYIRYYNFLDLKDFLSYLPERKQERIEKKKEKKEAKGKELSFSYYIESHDVITLNDGYLFIGEAYYPTYRTETYITYANGVPVTQYRVVFDGYQYTHATVCKFSKDGMLQWDVCFELSPGYKPFVPKKFVAVSERTASNIGMAYTSRNYIVSKKIDFSGEVIYDEKWELQGSGNENEKVKRTFSNVNYWFKNYFLGYGSQVIKGDGKRKVYFINKIAF